MNESPRDIVDQQANDPGLWFNARTAPEGYLQQELRRLHESVEACPKTKWQPIETAPKDGELVVCYDARLPAPHISLRPADGEWWVKYDNSPTHWMPLPEPPKGE